MRGFDFVVPTTISATLKAAKSRNTKFIAGGTNFLPDLRHQHDGPAKVVIDLMRVPALRGVSSSKGVVKLGALATMTDLLTDKAILKEAPVLAAMAEEIRRADHTESRHGGRQHHGRRPRGRRRSSPARAESEGETRERERKKNRRPR